VHVHSSQDHLQGLLERAILGELSANERAVLDRHLATCPICAVELEDGRMFRASVAPGRQDEALQRAAIDRAMERLRRRETLGERLGRWREHALRPSIAVAALGMAAMVVVGFVLVHTQQAKTSAPALPSAPVASLRSLILDDGSEITPATVTTEVQVAEQTPIRTTLRLRSGSAQFRIRHDSHRLFRVDAGAIQIEDLGTVFRVAHEAAGKIRVAVSEGRVAVLYPASQVRIELGAGESRLFDPLPVSGNALASPKEAPRRPTASSAATAGTLGEPRSRTTDEPAALLLAADLARRSHNPQAAVAPLRRLVEKYPKDPRAPSAAFTLGWVLLTDLGHPREAAAAFAEAERNARGTLAEDAASRVAEAWQKAGESRRADQAARHYEQLYPHGRYIPLMHGLIGEP
jgi:transmembrane sensor